MTDPGIYLRRRKRTSRATINKKKKYECFRPLTSHNFGGGHFLSFQPLPTPTNSKPPVKIGLKAVKAITVTE